MKRERKKIDNSIKTENLELGISKRSFLISIFLIIALSIIAYFPSLDNEITSWDDEFYINSNPYLKSLDKQTVSNLFNTKTYYMGNYHPLSMVSLSIDYAIGGEGEDGNIDPFIFHLTNLILHIFVSILVFLLALFLLNNINVAIATALLFAVHTLHVESVAWISERKDVLYSLFFVASLISYVKYTNNKNIIWYFAALLLFLLSLFSKGQAVSLAITLVIIDWFKGRKLTNIKIIIEKIPFFILAVLFGLIAIGAQKDSEALVDEQHYDFIQRIGIASYAFIQYIYKLILPINLSAIYPYPDIIHQKIPMAYYFMILPVLLIFTLTIWLFIKKKNKLVFGIAFFIVNIALLLQFIPVGSAVHSDRYSYIPSIGFFILVSVLLNKLFNKNKKYKKVIIAAFNLYIVLLTVLSLNRVDIWQNSETLWLDTTKKQPKSVIAWNNLGSFYDKRAKKAVETFNPKQSIFLRRNAINCFEKAIKGKPDYRNAFYNKGVSELELGKIISDTNLIKSSIIDFDKALKQDGQFAEAYFGRANAKSEIWQLNGALKDYNLAIGIKSSDETFLEMNTYLINRGVAYGKLGMLDKAILDFEKAKQIDVNEVSIYTNLGRAYMLKKDFEKAINILSEGLRIDPKSVPAYLNRGVAKQQNNNLEGALKDFLAIIKIDNNNATANFSVGKLLILLNRTDEACPYFTKAEKLGNKNAISFLNKYCK